MGRPLLSNAHAESPGGHRGPGELRFAGLRRRECAIDSPETQREGELL